MVFDALHMDLWYDIVGMLDINAASELYKASPRIFGAFIESKQEFVILTR
jgi:hypothetical protein